MTEDIKLNATLVIFLVSAVVYSLIQLMGIPKEERKQAVIMVGSTLAVFVGVVYILANR